MPTDPRSLYLGYRPDELATSRYARFFNPAMAPLAEPVRAAIATGGVAHELMPPVGDAALLQASGYLPVETGYTRSPDGALRVAILTPMPGVAPAMWDWWFGWHGSESQRYKLWHPRAHVAVGWADGGGAAGGYIGRTSRVVEYVGAARLNLDIRFVPPASIGLDAARLAAAGEVAICARGSLGGSPLETGWLIHHLRPVPGGCEMRSRFWVGGENVRLRGLGGGLGAGAGRLLGRLAARPPAEAADLLVHCAQEMAHLAAFLPALYAAFGPDGDAA